MQQPSLSKPIAILMTGHTYPHIERRFGDFDQWMTDPMIAALSQPSSEEPIQRSPYPHQSPITQTINICDNVSLPDINQFLDQYSGIIMTGSAAMVTDKAPWMVEAIEWLKALLESHPIPTLGVCFGHQLLAEALAGGKVDFHPKGREIGTHTITTLPACQDDPLFSNLPKTLDVHLTHRQSVLSLPNESTLLATGDFEPHQAFRYRDYAWGVQFHPEFTAAIMGAYISELSVALKQEAYDIDALQRVVKETPFGVKVLENFVRVVAEKEEC